MDRAGLEDVLGRVDELVQQTRDAMHDAMPGKPLGAEVATDAEFVREFERLTAENPNWPRALAFVDGGMETVARYERLRMRGG